MLLQVTRRLNKGEFSIQMSKKDSTFVLDFGDLCSYIISDVSNNVQTSEIHTFPKDTSVFHLVFCL